MRKRMSKIASMWSFWNAREKRVAKSSIQKGIAVSKKAESVIRANPGLIKNFFELRKEIIKGVGKVSIGNIVLENINSGKNGASATRFFKLNVGGELYFVKEIEKGKHGRMFSPQGEDPHRQLKALEVAKRVIEKNPRFRDWEVSVPHLAFSGSNKLFFVSEYSSGFNVEELRKSFELRKRHSGVVERFDSDYRELEGIMVEKGVGDFNDNNVLYSPLRKKFIIIDVRW